MKKNTVIRFRASKTEKDDIEAEAQKLGISVSDFLRLLFRNYSDGIRFEKDKTHDNDK